MLSMFITVTVIQQWSILLSMCLHQQLCIRIESIVSYWCLAVFTDGICTVVELCTPINDTNRRQLMNGIGLLTIRFGDGKQTRSSDWKMQIHPRRKQQPVIMRCKHQFPISETHAICVFHLQTIRWKSMRGNAFWIQKKAILSISKNASDQQLQKTIKSDLFVRKFQGHFDFSQFSCGTNFESAGKLCVFHQRVKCFDSIWQLCHFARILTADLTLRCKQIGRLNLCRITQFTSDCSDISAVYHWLFRF